MIKSRPHFGTLLIDKQVEIDVNVSSQCFVLCISVKLGLLLLLVFEASLRPRSLHLLDVIDHIARARLIILLHFIVKRVCLCLASAAVFPLWLAILFFSFLLIFESRVASQIIPVGLFLNFTAMTH